jgi:hypothetical protein
VRSGLKIFSCCARGLFLILLPLLAGCEFDPSEHTHSAVRPAVQFQDDVWWIPMKLEGDNDEWFWIPQDAAIATRVIDVPEGSSYSLLVNGKAWKIICHGNGTYAYEGFLDADISANPGLVFVSVLLGIASVLLACSTVVSAGLAHSYKRAFDNGEKEIETLKGYIRADQQEIHQTKEHVKVQIAQAFRDAEHRLTTECKKLKVEWDKLDADRDELEKQKRAMAVAANERQVVNHKPPTDVERRELGKMVRDRLLSGKEMNREIAVEYTIDPELTGALVFRWQLVQVRPYALSVTILRNTSVIRTASGVFNGEFGHWLKMPGQRYVFTFQLHDGSKALPEPLVMELTLPPINAWNRRGIPQVPPTKPTEAERRRQADEWEAREKQRARQCEKDPEKLKRLFARIEQERIERFGEAA